MRRLEARIGQRRISPLSDFFQRREIELSTDFIKAFTIFGKGIRDFRMISGELKVF